MHEIQRPAGGFVAWKMCENTHTMDAPGCAGEASMWVAGLRDGGTRTVTDLTDFFFFCHPDFILFYACGKFDGLGNYIHNDLGIR